MNAVRKRKSNKSKKIVTLPAVNTSVCFVCVPSIHVSLAEKKKTRGLRRFSHHRAVTPEPPKTRPSMPLILLTLLPPSCRSLSSSALIS